MGYKLVFCVVLCVAIVRADPCPNNKTILLPEDLFCCHNNSTHWSTVISLDDPCLVNTGDNGYDDDFNCRVECFYKEHNLMANGKLNIENVEKLLARIKDETARNTFLEAFKNCDAMEKPKLVNSFEDTEPASKCAKHWITFNMCVTLNIIARCLKELMDGKPYCASRIDHLNKCIFN